MVYSKEIYKFTYNSSEQYRYNTRQAKTFSKHVPTKNEVVNKIASQVQKSSKKYKENKKFKKEIEKSSLTRNMETGQRGSIPSFVDWMRAR